MSLSLVLGQPTPLALAQLPPAVAWLRYDFEGLPSELSEKHLLFVFPTEAEILRPNQVINKVTKALTHYPYPYSIRSREALHLQLKDASLTDYYDYQLKLVYTVNGVNVIIEDLHTGIRYCPKYRAFFQVKVVLKDFLTISKYQLGALNQEPYPKKGRPSFPVGSLRPTLMEYPEADFFGLPPDLDKKPLLYVEIDPEVFSYRSFKLRMNDHIRQVLDHYPHQVEIYPSDTQSITSIQGYQLRCAYIIDERALMSKGGVAFNDQKQYFVVIEDLQTGKRYAPHPGGTLLPGKAIKPFETMVQQCF